MVECNLKGRWQGWPLVDCLLSVSKDFDLGWFLFFLCLNPTFCWDPGYRSQEEDRGAGSYTILKLARLWWSGHFTKEWLMTGYQRRSSMENLTGKALPRWPEDRNKATFKASLKDLIYRQSPWNRLHMIEQSGLSSSEKEQTATKPRESAKLNENAKRANQEGTVH